MTSAANGLRARLTALRLDASVSNTISLAGAKAKPISAASGAPDSATLDTTRYRFRLMMSKTSSRVIGVSLLARVRVRARSPEPSPLLSARDLRNLAHDLKRPFE